MNTQTVFNNLPTHLQGGVVYIFFISRVTTKKSGLIRAKQKYVESGQDDVRTKTKKHRSVERLEYALIGTCRTTNERLLNVQLKRFQEGLIVPGYIGDSPSSKLDESSQSLQKMLQRKAASQA